MSTSKPPRKVYKKVEVLRPSVAGGSHWLSSLNAEEKKKHVHKSGDSAGRIRVSTIALQGIGQSSRMARELMDRGVQHEDRLQMQRLSQAQQRSRPRSHYRFLPSRTGRVARELMHRVSPPQPCGSPSVRAKRMAYCPGIHGDTVCFHVDCVTETAEWHRDRWLVVSLSGFTQVRVSGAESRRSRGIHEDVREVAFCAPGARICSAREILALKPVTLRPAEGHVETG